jgi:hypothetical protein
MYSPCSFKVDPGRKAGADGGKLPGFAGTHDKSGWGGCKGNGSDG